MEYQKGSLFFTRRGDLAVIKNATAHITLPRGNKTARTRNVIIIDDNPADRVALKKMVRASKAPQCNVSSFNGIEEALSSNELTRADLILLDDRLAGGQRAEHSLKELREGGITCPAIVISAFVSRKRDQKVIRHGAVQYTPKDELNPTTMQRLLAYGLTARGLWSLDGT